MKIGKSAFERGVGRAMKQTMRLEKELQTIQQMAESNNMMEAYELSLKAEEISEHLTLLMRSLPVYTGNPTASTAAAEVTSNQIPVEMGYTENGWFVIRLPLLLPKKESGTADYIRSFLYPAMRKFFESASPMKFNNCVLVYRHVYDKNRPEREWRDHDNIELNMVTDIVALYLLEDDAPRTCRHYYCSAAGLKEQTEVYVVPRKDFPKFLSMEDNIPDKGVKLYEIRSVLEKKSEEKDVPQAY